MNGFDVASTAADKVDSVFLFIFVLSVIFLAGITATMLTFVYRYSRKRNPKPVDIEGHMGLEITWTIIPLVLFLAMFWFGWTNYSYLRNAPRNAMVVEVTGRQWAWSFKYPNGKTTDDLFLAIDKPVKLELRSQDVIHGFWIPAFRVKEDVVPGRVNTMWFTPTLYGSFDIECTVICGVQHTYMLAKAHVISEDAYKQWYFGGDDAPLPDPNAPPPPKVAPAKADNATSPAQDATRAGLAVLNDRKCLTCHTLDGAPSTGPTFKGLYGSTVTVADTAAGAAVLAVEVDDAFVRRAILDPNSQIAKGFPPSMPAQKLTDGEVASVASYLRALR